jgi:hypothetical protein
MHTLKHLFGLRLGPNPFSCHWIGEVWEDYASLKVSSPLTILLDRTPVSSLAGFETNSVEIGQIVTALVQDNPTFPLYDVAYMWLEKTAPINCTLHIVWKLSYRSVLIGNGIRGINNSVEVILSISAVDNPNMLPIRTLIAGTLAHFKIMTESPSCDWNQQRLKQWSDLVAKNLRIPRTIHPLRQLSQGVSTTPEPHDVTAINPCTAVALNNPLPPQSYALALIPPDRPLQQPDMLTRHPVIPTTEPNIQELIVQAVSQQVALINESNQQKEQDNVARLAAIEKEQSAARDRDSLYLSIMKETQESNKRIMHAVEKLATAQLPSVPFMPGFIPGTYTPIPPGQPGHIPYPGHPDHHWTLPPGQLALPSEPMTEGRIYSSPLFKSTGKVSTPSRTPFPLETCDVHHSETGSSDGLSPDRSHTIYE